MRPSFACLPATLVSPARASALCAALHRETSWWRWTASAKTSFERYWAHPLLSDRRRVRHDDMDKAPDSPDSPSADLCYNLKGERLREGNAADGLARRSPLSYLLVRRAEAPGEEQ